MTSPHAPDETVTDEEIDQAVNTLTSLYGHDGMERITATIRELRKESARESAAQAYENKIDHAINLVETTMRGKHDADEVDKIVESLQVLRRTHTIRSAA